jgi:D-2-hydroxyacid dehydrogenase (NADP+)
MTESKLIVLNEEVPAPALTRIRNLAPQYRVVTKDESRSDSRFIREAELLYTHAVPQKLLLANERLRWIQTLGAGVEWLLTPEIKQRKDLIVTNASGVHAQPIAEQVFGYMLMFDRQLHVARSQQASGSWTRPSQSALLTLNRKTLGILGVGAIGKRIAEIARTFGMRVIGLSRRGKPIEGVDQIYPPEQLHTLLGEAHYIVNALPLTAATRNAIDDAEFAAMRSDAFFVNIGRGATVNTDALLRALQDKRIAGAGLDVTEPEPLPPEHPLWQLENAIITPHYAGGRADYSELVAAIFVDNLERILSGKPLLNVVDKDAGY